MPKGVMRKTRGRGIQHPVDVYVGARVRQQRIVLGMSQENLGKIIGLTFQQIQKYERGKNRVSASRLYEIAHALQVPLTYFFEGFEDAPIVTDGQPNQLLRRETLELVRDYYAIKSELVRQRMHDLIRSCAGHSA